MKNIFKFLLLFTFLWCTPAHAATKYLQGDGWFTNDLTKLFAQPVASGTVSCVLCTETLANKTINVASNTIIGIVDANIASAASIDATKIAAGAVTGTEFGYLDGVTSAIQTQLNLKAPAANPTFTGTITTPLTASRAVVTGTSNELAAATTTATEIGYVNGVTSAIQTQLNAKASSTLTSGNIFVGNASNVATGVAMTGDIAITNGGVTSYSGTVPISKGGTGATTSGTAFNALQPMNAIGQIIVGGASGAAQALPNGTTGQVLIANTGGIPNWGTNAPTPINASIICRGGNGYGSTSTKIRRFDSCTTVGTDVTGADSATLGEVFTINTAGVYCIHRVDNSTSGNADIGLSLNSSQLTTNIQSITATDIITVWEQNSTSTTSFGSLGVCQYFAASDVIRAHDAVANTDTADVYVRIRIQRVN